MGEERSAVMGKITPKQYEYLLPVNKKYSKWLDDKVTTMRVYKPFAHLFEEIYYHFYKRDGKWHIISEKYGESFEGILELVKEKSITLTDSKNSRRIIIPSFDGLVRDSESNIAADSLEAMILNDNMKNDNWNTDVGIISEVIESNGIAGNQVLRVYMLNKEGSNPQIGDIFLIENAHETEECPVSWQKVKNVGEFLSLKKLETELTRLCRYTPQIEFFAIDVVPTLNSSYGFKITSMDSNPPYPTTCAEGFSDIIDEYLQACLKDKQRNFLQSEYEKAQHQIGERKKQAESLYPKGYYPFLEKTASSEFLTNFKSDRLLRIEQEERWISERGFNHHRIEQYGISESNHKNFISDFEYEYLGHINNKYRVWFEDKVTIKYILSDFSECMTAYYYLIAKNKIIPLMDCPKGYIGSYEDIFRLVRTRGILALKLDEGTHGKGFFKFTFLSGKYYLNEKESSKEEIIAMLNEVNNQYLVTEFIQQHPSLAHIYPGSVNTARLIVFKKDGRTAQIGNGYMRFGNSETGGVDNVGAGGIGADLDISTGYYNNAVRIRNNMTIESCSKHPDTGVPIEGYLPNWNNVIQTVLKIADSLPEIEYMGFDVAFTKDGIKLPELNRFPDFPKLNKLTPETTDYLLYKLEKKKEKYGYVFGWNGQEKLD